MRLISNKALREFAERHPMAYSPLQAFRRQIEQQDFSGFADLRTCFGGVDKVGDLYVFDIGGNKFRLIAAIQFAARRVFVRAILTHREYDKGDWK